MGTHAKAVVLLIAAVLLTFSNSLLNGFTGDDEVIVVNNSFYKSFENLPRLFAKDYVVGSDRYFLEQNAYSDTGDVSYRPVAAFFYFLDYAAWKLNPSGYHLHSILLHLINTLLVYFLVHRLAGEKYAAFLSALLFGIHPMKTEAVCAISYRHDLLACFFVLVSFLCYLWYSERAGLKRMFLYTASLVAFLLGVFAKESAIVLPLLIVAHDRIFREYRCADMLRRGRSVYLGYGIAAAFYLYVYIVLFPNSAVSNNPLMGGSLASHVISMFVLFQDYIVSLCVPVFANNIPPLYAPPLTPAGAYQTLLAVGILIFLAVIIIRAYRRTRHVAFFLSWFLIAYIPVSNIIPLANPLAHRFLYLPSVGFLAALAFALVWTEERVRGIRPLPTLGKIITFSFVGMCLITTVILNGSWQSNFVLASGWVRDYPQDAKGYAILSIEYFKAYQCPEAKGMAQQSLALGARDPRLPYIIGMCSLDDPAAAEASFQQALAMAPAYASAYRGLGKLHLLQGHYTEAIAPLEQSAALTPAYSTYQYLIIAYMQTGQRPKALSVLKKAAAIATDQDHFLFLKSLTEKTDETPPSRTP